mmetsp:Transcript_2981/g.6793  ORF Transcript_2981/g.6793 Transcript_2981/m.6793 type:complete len:211 (-) Transcript_2981:2-634(-)
MLCLLPGEGNLLGAESEGEDFVEGGTDRHLKRRRTAQPSTLGNVAADDNLCALEGKLLVLLEHLADTADVVAPELFLGLRLDDGLGERELVWFAVKVCSNSSDGVVLGGCHGAHHVVVNGARHHEPVVVVCVLANQVHTPGSGKDVFRILPKRLPEAVLHVAHSTISCACPLPFRTTGSHLGQDPTGRAQPEEGRNQERDPQHCSQTRGF